MTTPPTTFQLAPQRQWIPPQPVYDAGQRANVTRTGGSVYRAGERVQKPIAPAMSELYRWILANFPGVTPQGLPRDSSRNSAVGTNRDIHEEGRAGDFGFAVPSVGHGLANWLVFHAEEIGVQLVICDRTEWSSSNSLPKWEDYRSPPAASSHSDHVHMEISVASAAQSAGAMTARLNAIVAREGGIAIGPLGPPADPRRGPPPMVTGHAGLPPSGGTPTPPRGASGSGAGGALLAAVVVTAATAFIGWLIYGKN